MHIALVTAEYPPVWGGIGAFAYYLSGAFARNGHQVLVITRDVGKEAPATDGVEVVRLKDTRIRFLSPRLFGNRAAEFLSTGKNVDVIHLSYPLLGLTPEELALMGRPTVATMHGSWHGERKALQHSGFSELTLNDATVKLLGGFLRRYETIALQNCQGITTVSQFAADELRQNYSFPDKPVDIIPNGVDTERFHPRAEARGQIINELHLETETGLFLCVGRLVGRKGIPDLLDAFNICSRNSTRPLTLMLVGEGRLKERIWNRAATLGLRNNLIIRSGLSAEQLALTMAAADVFVLPSCYEAFGMVYLESMACGTPVVGARVGGIPEVVTEGKDGLLCQPNNPKDLAEKMLTLMNQSDKRERLGENGRQKVLNQFTWDHVSRMYLESFETALRSNT